MSTFLLINIVVLAIPLILNQRRKNRIGINYLSLLIAIFVNGGLFLIMNYFYYNIGLIDFNYDNLVGLTVFDIPIEYYFFFIVFPYAYIFLYKWTKLYFCHSRPVRLIYGLSLIFTILCIVLALKYSDKPYAFRSFLLAGSLNWIIYFGFTPRWYAYFIFSFLFVSFPYLLIDGTMTLLDVGPTTIYHEDGIVGFHVFTLPLEDIFNFFTLFILTITVYEGVTKKLLNIKYRRLREEVYQYKKST